MRPFVPLSAATAIAIAIGLSPTTASACMIIPFERIEKASDVIVEGRYFQDATDHASGHVEPHRVTRGNRLDRYEIRWSLELLEDPTQGQCATQIPRNGRYERFYLLERDDGTFSMIGRAGAERPNHPEESD